MVDERARSDLFALLDGGLTPPHAANLLFARFAGNSELTVRRIGPGALSAVRNGMEKPWESGVRILVSHLDSPCWSVKHQPDSHDTLARLSLSPYGGMIRESFCDCPLRLAGQAFLSRGDGTVEAVDFASERHAVIPSLAPHLQDRTASGAPSVQDGLRAVWSRSETTLRAALCREMGWREEDLLTLDAWLVPADAARLLSCEEDLCLAPRLDDLGLAWVAATAIEDPKPSPSAAMAVFTNHEEIGSMSREGAFSGLFSDVLEELVERNGGGRSELRRTLERSRLVSLDQAHGFHPNHPGRYDRDNAPRLGGGPAIKRSARGAYAHDGALQAELIDTARQAGITIQHYENHGDVRGGSTMGPMASAMARVPAVDVGVAVLAMHAARELASLEDLIACGAWMRAWLKR